jgi:hypothetical protein
MQSKIPKDIFEEKMPLRYLPHFEISFNPSIQMSPLLSSDDKPSRKRVLPFASPRPPACDPRCSDWRRPATFASTQGPPPPLSGYCGPGRTLLSLFRLLCDTARLPVCGRNPTRPWPAPRPASAPGRAPSFLHDAFMIAFHPMCPGAG